MPLRPALLLAVLLAAHAGAAPAPEPIVTVAFGESLEPYAIPPLGSGIEVDIVREALQQQGLQLKPLFLAQKRLPYALGSKEMDAVATMLPNYGVNGAYSEPYIQYQDKAITLAERNLAITSIGDLARYRVLGFPLASQYLGSAFRQLTQQHPAYSETGNQLDQNRLLFRGSVDVVVADVRIFSYMNRRMQSDFHETPRPVHYHNLFPQLSYRVLFRSPQQRDAFNHGLRQLQQSGRYQQIIDKYDAELGAD
ncbi:substrate-binding periplasmic protein [Vogesella facilis]|uniref:Substrate-binding periplasmic protein n=1 Tax=Vogesella facilis TaxID=1655232 RepID=A0ABV7R8D4_9NEIS